jgi:hypothetical protein
MIIIIIIISRVRDVVSLRKKIKVLNNNFVMSVGIRQVVTFYWWYNARKQKNDSVLGYA